MSDPLGQLGEYARRILSGDLSWQEHGACVGVSPEVTKMFVCIEEEEFTHGAATATGLQAQKYVVETFCQGCAVQWECARFACEFEEPIGVWGLTMRDRRWLMKQRNPLGIIDAARLEGVPVSILVNERRSAMRRHPAMRYRVPAAV